MLKEHQWLGGELPCAADREVFEQLDEDLNVNKYPHAFAWYSLVSICRPAVRAQWTGQAVVVSVQDVLFAMALTEDAPVSDEIMENLIRLKETDPVSYVAELKALGRHQERKNYCMETVYFYSIYIVDYLEPSLEDLRRERRLQPGKKTIRRRKDKHDDSIWEYVGELNEEGLATGYGEATCKALQEKYCGTFVDDVWEGIGVFIDKHGRRHDAEYKQGKWHGKLTVHYPEGGVLNQTFKNGEKQTNANITSN